VFEDRAVSGFWAMLGPDRGPMDWEGLVFSSAQHLYYGALLYALRLNPVTKERYEEKEEW